MVLFSFIPFHLNVFKELDPLLPLNLASLPTRWLVLCWGILRQSYVTTVIT